MIISSDSSFFPAKGDNGRMKLVAHVETPRDTGRTRGAHRGDGTWDRVTFDHIDNIVFVQSIIIALLFLSAGPIAANTIVATAQGAVNFSTLSVSLNGQAMKSVTTTSCVPVGTPSRGVTYLTLCVLRARHAADELSLKTPRSPRCSPPPPTPAEGERDPSIHHTQRSSFREPPNFALPADAPEREGSTEARRRWGALKFGEWHGLETVTPVFEIPSPAHLDVLGRESSPGAVQHRKGTPAHPSASDARPCGAYPLTAPASAKELARTSRTVISHAEMSEGSRAGETANISGAIQFLLPDVMASCGSLCPL
ncbi:hypothetical protein FB451DRAFT_1394979 [Mycena latifolia]|nr:hypothetical protein FB451DRAFT_1394979 [Mycena latifolia]